LSGGVVRVGYRRSGLKVLGGTGNRRALHVFHRADHHPLGRPGDLLGREAELKEFYASLLPGLIAEARGEDPSSSRVLSEPPLRMVVTGARHHVGSWQDMAVLDVLFERWIERHRLGSADIFTDWPSSVPFD